MVKYLVILFFIMSGCANEKPVDIQFPEGGYAYPAKADDNKKSFFYPIHDLLSTRDSFDKCTFAEYLFNSFEEPNLSVAPPKKPVLRFVYFPGGTRYTAIVTLHPNEIIIKELKTGYAMPYKQKENLDSLELHHYNLLESYFPLQEFEGSTRTKELDSLVHLFPQLLDPKYFRKLTLKAHTFGPEKFTYNRKKISLDSPTYKYFVDLFNNSGYPKMKLIEDSCRGQASHSDSYLLETATQDRYYFVSYTKCFEHPTRFDRACEELIKYAGVDEDEKRWHKELMSGIKRLD